MPPLIDEDEFGDGDFDEADLLDLVPVKGGTKRKASSDGNTSPKRLQTTFPCAVAALSGKFGFKSFQLKQEQVKGSLCIAIVGANVHS
jgi:predicted acyltransferase